MPNIRSEKKRKKFQNGPKSFLSRTKLRGSVGNAKQSIFILGLSPVSGVGSSPALATCETSQVLLAGVAGGFPGVLPFRPTHRLALLYE